MSDDTDPRQPIFDILDALRRDYERAAEPWIRLLADYEAHQPPRPLVFLAGSTIDHTALLKALEGKP
jgi:hypothetical protein